MMRLAAAGALTTALLLGCRLEFTCSDDAECVWKDRRGTCEAVGHCSYPDAACPSMQRFGPHAGALSNVCTEPAATTGSIADVPTAGETTGAPGRPIPDGMLPPAMPREGIWISAPEIMALPTEGEAWSAVLELADATPMPATLSGYSDHNIHAYANALLCVRLDDASRCDAARDGLLAATQLVPESNAQDLAEQLLAYVVVADLLALDAADEDVVQGWLRAMRDEDVGGRTLVSTHEDRPNNWGTQAGAVRGAIAIYLDEPDELQATADVLRGWLGARDVYDAFDFGEPWWQADPQAPVGINPAGATIEGYDVDGAIPDALRVDGMFEWPPPGMGVPGYGALTGAIVLAVILHRRGFDVWNWEDAAIGRAWVWQWDVAGFRPSTSRNWIVAPVAAAYGFAHAFDPSTSAGTSLALTAWTHG